MAKIGRNDPCPCGSGKKYKQCCLKHQEDQAAEARHDRSFAVPKAIDWLSSRHGKAMQAALDEGYFGGLDDDGYDRLQDLDDSIHEMVTINAMEWLLAEGRIQVKGNEVPISELLLGSGGPFFSVVQRQWLEQLGMARLGLYEVIDLVPGESLCLRDVLFPELDPIWVREKSGSRDAAKFDLMAARIMTVDGHHELSGAIYGFHRHNSLDMLDELQRELEGLAPDSYEAREILGSIIPDRWLDMLTAPFTLPELVDMTTGEPLLFITDHYRVLDWATLENRLASQPDIEGDREEGWERIFEGQDGLHRSSLTIDLGERPDRIKVAYRIQRYADEGRPWFESLTDSTVTFVARDISDPKGVLANRDPSAEPKPSDSASIPPEVLTEVIGQRLRELYANWADEPLPALDNQSPREAMVTPEGLEQVKFLLRTYEHGEVAQAKQQNRQPVSFDFLWEGLGISQ